MNAQLQRNSERKLLFTESNNIDGYAISRFIIQPGKDTLVYTQQEGFVHLMCISGYGRIFMVDPPKTLKEGSIFKFERGDHYKIYPGTDYQIINNDLENIMVAIEIDQPNLLN